MRSSIAAALFPIAGFVSAAPFMFPGPLRSGFPAPDSAHLAKIQKNAGGMLPNGPLPTDISASAIATFQLVAAQETFEVAYFTDLLHNISTGVAGYTGVPDLVQKTIFAIRAQEELHAIGANAILASVGQKAIAPCAYNFPVTTFDDAIALAALFTDVVLGTLQAAELGFATDGGQELGLIPLVASIAEQEGEQTGLFRFLQNKFASSAPFLTASAPQFAWSALKMFLAPGSCPTTMSTIEAGIGSFPALSILNTPEQRHMMIKYSAAGTGITAAGNSIVYITGQLLPMTFPISNVVTSGGMTTFMAPFPWDSGFSKGLTIAALVTGSSNYTSAPAVAADTINGPGLIDV